MFKGFREFILRGNVIDLAVAVVIGAAFGAIVSSLVDAVLNPAIGALFNAESLKEIWILAIPTTSGGTAEIKLGAVVAAVIQFVLVAAVVYFALVTPINYLKKVSVRKKDEAPPTEMPPTETELLTEIRDLLRSRSSGSAG
jgi:large conductance mechanosensitive channel